MGDCFEGEAAGAGTKSADRRYHDRHRERDESEDCVDPAQIELKGDDEALERRRQPAPGIDKPDRARADAGRE